MQTEGRPSVVPHRSKEKDPSIETLRGLAILLVVAGYIIKDDLGHGAAEAGSPVSSALQFLYYLLTPVRIPLFTVISAYLYAASPAGPGMFRKLVAGKARRILVPFAVVSFAQYVVLALVPSGAQRPLSQIYRAYLYPYEQLWFLISIFWIFVLVGALDARGMLGSVKKWAPVLAAALALHLLVTPTRLFSLNGVNYLLPFFLLGYGIRRYGARLLGRRGCVACLAAAVPVTAAYAALYFAQHADRFPAWSYRVLGLVMSFTLVPLLMRYRPKIAWLAWVGSYAFGIHLFNKIGLAPIKAAFLRAGVSNDALTFVAYLAGCVLAAIAIQTLLERHAWTRRFVLGLKEGRPEAPARVAAPSRRPLGHVLLRPTPLRAAAAAFALFLVGASLPASQRDADACARSGSCGSECAPCPGMCAHANR